MKLCKKGPKIRTKILPFYVMPYCISVWGGAPSCTTDKLFTSQKHCIRILFGNKQEYLEKYRTCARARPLTKQKLTNEFFEKEHTKPLFTKHSILALRNLYTYHTFMEVFKILKLRVPPSLSDYFARSHRKETTLITVVYNCYNCLSYS